MGKRRTANAPSSRTTGRDRVAAIAVATLLIATIALAAFVRIRLADTPLERDEGEYAYAGQLILQGTPPYALVYNMKFPGVYYSYALLMSVFGESPRGIRIGLLCVNLATALFVFGLARRLAGPTAGGIAAASFLLLSLDSFAMGVFAHATHFVALPVVAALFVLWPAFDHPQAWRFVVCGVLMGVAIAMKQHALAFAMLAMGLAAWPARNAGAGAWRDGLLRLGLVMVGMAATFVVMLAVLASAGVFDRFWFWTFRYARAYVTQTPFSQAPQVFALAWGYVTHASAVLWYAGLAGALLIAAGPWPWRVRLMLWTWLAAAALAILPGFYFRPHYFILAMPVVACLIAVAIGTLERWLTRFRPTRAASLLAFSVFVAVAGVYIWVNSHYFFRMNSHQLVRLLYETNPFEESVAIGRYIREHSRPGDRIAVLGSEPQIYFYANRRAATGYIYTYPLMEPQPYAAQMQAEMRREIEDARPLFFVFVASRMSWLSRPTSDMGILTWANEFTSRCYGRVGLIDVHARGPATIVWDVESLRYVPRSASQVYVLRRLSAPACAPAAE